MKIQHCDYNGCSNTSETHNIENYGTEKEPQLVCSECDHKYDSGDTGYCSALCKLGYGCDDSC